MVYYETTWGRSQDHITRKLDRPEIG